MNVVGVLHGRYVHHRRALKLSQHLAGLIPEKSRVLDVGCGDGLLSCRIAQDRPDICVEGVDLKARPGAHIATREFDGRSLPFADRSHDVVMMVDLLHHTSDPMLLLAEAVRVSGAAVLIKDHVLNGPLARSTLRFMDFVGNARHGIGLPGNYWPQGRWEEAFEELDVSVDHWSSKLGIYPWPVSWAFERSLHFIARLLPPREVTAPRPGR